MPLRTVRPAAGKAGASRTARDPKARCAARISAANGPRAAESIFLNKSALGFDARTAAVRATMRDALAGESERESVLKACTGSVAGKVAAAPSQTRTARPVRRNAAAESQAPVKSSARRRICSGSEVLGRTEWRSGLAAAVGMKAAVLYFREYMIIF